jgi:hypothetical protein
MRLRTIFLTAIMVSGFAFQNCNPFEVDCNCPPFLGDYFDIQGIELINYKKRGECCVDKILGNEEVKFSDYHGLTIDCVVEYHTSNCNRNKPWGFSIINSALACSCLENGWEGSKEEKLTSMTILTLNDFDDEHLANDTINALFEVRFHNEILDLNEYLLQDTSIMKFEDFGLKLKKAPELDNEFKIKVIMELSTNEIYESESLPIKIIK